MKPYYFEVLDGVRRNRGDDWTNLSHDEKCLLVGALLIGLRDTFRSDFLDRVLTDGAVDVLADMMDGGWDCQGAHVLAGKMKDAAIETYGPDIAYDLENPGEPSQFAGQFKDLA